MKTVELSYEYVDNQGDVTFAILFHGIMCRKNMFLKAVSDGAGNKKYARIRIEHTKTCKMSSWYKLDEYRFMTIHESVDIKDDSRVEAITSPYLQKRIDQCIKEKFVYARKEVDEDKYD